MSTNSFFSDLDSPPSAEERSSSFFTDLPQRDESLKGHAQRKIGGPAIEFATKALTSIPNFIDFVQEMGVKGANFALKKLGAKGLEEEDLKKVISLSKGLGPTAGIPQAENLIEEIHKQTKDKFRPQSEAEKVLQKGAGIIGSIAGFGPGAALGTPARAAGTLALGGTTAALEEEGVNPWAALGGGLLADIATRSGGKALKRFGSSLSKGFAGTAGEMVSKAARVKPEQVKQLVLEAGERLGIKPSEIPLSAQLDNPIIQGIESKVRASSLSGRSLQQQLENVGQKLTKTYEDIGSQLSKRQELLPSAVSQEAVTALQRIEESAEQAYRGYYSQAEKYLPKAAAIPENMGRAVHKILDHTLGKLKSDLGTPAKDTLYNRLSRLKKNWEGITPTVEQVLEAKKDLNQVIKYEVQGGVDKMLEPLAGVLRQSIQSYGKGNQPFLFRFNEAERLFADSARNFRKNPTIRSLLKGQAPEQVINKMGTVKGIRDLGKVFGKSPEGREAFDALKKYKLEQILGSKLLNKKGEISWGNASGMLKNPKTRDQVLELVGTQNYKKLKDLAKVSQGVEEGLRKFLNTSQTATSHFDIAMLVGMPIRAVSLLLSGQPLKAAATAGGLFTPKIMADLLSNPEFIEAAKRTAMAGKGSNMSHFLKEAQNTARIVLSAISSVGIRPEEPNESP